MRRKDWLLGGATALVVVARMVWILAFAPLPAPAQIQSNTARHIIYGISLPATCYAEYRRRVSSGRRRHRQLSMLGD